MSSAVPFTHLQHKQRETRSKHRLEQRRFPDILRFLDDHLPETADKVRKCDPAGKIYRDHAAGDRWKLGPYACHQDPWCLRCTRAKHVLRTNKAMERFEKCTPGDQLPRFIHIVQMAPAGPDPAFWGNKASEDHKGLFRMVWDVCKEVLETGIGVYMSYHDFGESGPGHLSPHVDFTLNGWRLGDDGPGLTTWPFKNSQKKWHTSLNQKATRYTLQPLLNANVKANRPAVGRPEYWRGLAYQMRELVDLRKMTYDRPRQLVYWKSYRHNTRTKSRVFDFKWALREHSLRTGAWQRGQGQNFHQAFGHLSDRSVNRTMKAMGGVLRPHRRNCTCSECGAWMREFIELDGDLF